MFWPELRVYSTKSKCMSLIFSAVDQQSIPQLMERIEQELCCWEGQYAALKKQEQHLAPVIEGWIQRIGFTKEILNGVKEGEQG